MPLEEWVVGELGGMNRNAAEGVTEQQPVELVNMVPTKQGGWQVRGLVRRTDSSTSYGGYSRVVGYDHAGYSTFSRADPSVAANDLLALVRLPGNDRTERSAIRRTGEYVHLPQAGVYAVTLPQGNTTGTDQSFFVEAKDAAALVSSTGTMRAEVVANTASGALPIGSYRAYAFTYIRTPGGKLYTDATMWFVSLTATGSLVASLPTGSPAYMGAEIYLGRDPQATTTADMFSKSSGAIARPLEYVLQTDLSATNRSFTIGEVQFGAPINLNGYGTPMLSTLTPIGTSFNPIGVHNQRVFFRPSQNNSAYTLNWFSGGTRYSNSGDQWQGSIDRYTSLTVAWTEQGMLNVFNLVKSFYTLPATNSKEITGFTSTEEGLVVWLDNEAFMMRGDPSFAEQPDFSYEDFNFRPYLSIGHDRGAPPGLLGNLTYPIWNGEVYQVSGGQTENISRPVYDRTDRFVQVIGDVERNCVLCRTQLGIVYAYYPDDGFWCRIYNAIKLLLPAATEAYAVPDGENGLLHMARPETSPAEVTDDTLNEKPIARFRWSFDNKRDLKMLKFVRMYVSRAFSGVVVMRYGVDGINADDPITPYRRGDELIFALPIGWVGSQFDVTFEFSRMVAASTIEPPIIAEYVTVRRKR